MFLGTHEKQLDAKRRIVAPADFRSALGGAPDVFLFKSIRGDCLEGGGEDLIRRYAEMVEGLRFGDPLLDAIERSVFSGGARFAFDTAGRITLPEQLCADYGITDWVVLVGLRDRFEIWEREAYRARQAADRAFAQTGLAELRERQRLAGIERTP